ncbi:MAG: hypothetical protein ACLGSH_17720 [Acidobacteriota bacterium]
MPTFEFMRDPVSAPFGELIRQRTAAGWQMVSIEWRRERPGAEAPARRDPAEDLPYGLRISADGQRLETDPQEHDALMEMMEGLAQDFPDSAIVGALNAKGFRQRNGRPWSRIAVFNMLPRLIDVGPGFFASEEWQRRSRHFEATRPASGSSG